MLRRRRGRGCSVAKSIDAVCVALVARDRALELADPAAQRLAGVGEALGTEDHQGDGEDDDQLDRPDAREHRGHPLKEWKSPSGSGRTGVYGSNLKARPGSKPALAAACLSAKGSSALTARLMRRQPSVRSSPLLLGGSTLSALPWMPV